MKARLVSTNRKDYKTKMEYDPNGFPYLCWEVYPESLDPSKLDTLEGKRVWLAGTSMSDKWFITQRHEVGSPMFPSGGYTLVNVHKEVTNVLPQEVILHPSENSKRKNKKSKK